MSKIGITSINILGVQSKNAKREHTPMQMIQPVFVGFESVSVPPKCLNQTWKKKNKNSRF